MNNLEQKNQNSSILSDQLRQAVPYVNAHRGRTMVIYLSPDILHHASLEALVHDITLLKSIGAQLILTFEPEALPPQRSLSQEEWQQQIHTVSFEEKKITALFSRGLVNSPMHGAEIATMVSNVVLARPKGIVEGVDFEHLGDVRRIRVDAIKQALSQHFLLIVPPLGFSPSGEMFRLRGLDVARHIAGALRADKLIAISSELLRNEKNENLREWLPDNDLSESLNESQTQLRQLARDALAQGVSKIHFIDGLKNGALLEELFTLNGCGTLVASKSNERLRAATLHDLGGILKLLKPYEDDGTLVKRNRESIENELNEFVIVELDGSVIGCAALHVFESEKIAEIYAVAIDPKQAGQGRGRRLLERLENTARERNLEEVFILTTQAAHWFLEQGYERGDLQDLPIKRQALYNIQRKSVIYIKKLK